MFRSQIAAALLAGALSLAASIGAAQTPQELKKDDTARIRAALTQWTADFNVGKTEKVCGLFALEAIANVRGAPERDYKAICDVLQRSLKDRTRSYAYSFAIKEILVSGDFAVVRLVWTLKLRRKGAREVTSVEPGMDIFRRQSDGSWKIVRYMAYEDERLSLIHI